MKAFFKYFLLIIFMYLSLKFVVDNPKEISKIKDFIDTTAHETIDKSKDIIEIIIS